MALPTFSLSINSALSAVRNLSVTSIIQSTLSPKYGIYYAQGDNINQVALAFNSVLKFDASVNSQITTVALESDGLTVNGYTALNKTAQPAQIKMRVAVTGATAYSGLVPNLPTYDANTTTSGFNFQSRTTFKNRINEMRNAAGLYNIETPDIVYANYDLVSCSFSSTGSSGMTLLAADLVFQEISTRQTSKRNSNTAEKVGVTQVSPIVKKVF